MSFLTENQKQAFAKLELAIKSNFPQVKKIHCNCNELHKNILILEITDIIYDWKKQRCYNLKYQNCDIPYVEFKVYCNEMATKIYPISLKRKHWVTTKEYLGYIDVYSEKDGNYTYTYSAIPIKRRKTFKGKYGIETIIEIKKMCSKIYITEKEFTKKHKNKYLCRKSSLYYAEIER